MRFLFQCKVGGRLGYPVCTVCSGLTFSCRLCSVPLEKQPLIDPPDDKQRSPVPVSVPVPGVSVVQISRTVTMLFSLP